MRSGQRFSFVSLPVSHVDVPPSYQTLILAMKQNVDLY